MRCGLLGFLSFGIAMSMAGLSMVGLGCDSASRGVGRACDLTVADAGTYQTTVNWNSSTCPSGVCLRPAGNLDTKPTGATCTAECESDSDCAGESANPNDPLDTRCHGGFACVVPFAVGPLCCKHLCVCKDFLRTDGAKIPVACQDADSVARCQSTAGSASKVGVGAEADLYLTIAPRRKLDLVFMIDNSPSMAAKVAKLNSQFPKMVDVLKDPTDGYLPDLRIAMIDSDLGTGGAYQSGACGPNERNGGSILGDLGNFQMPGAADCGVDPGALWLEYARGRPTNFARDLDMGQVFGCIAGNLGSQGCEAEHQLQALTFALGGSTLHPTLQSGFLRPEAYLGLIIVTDEDDCSAGTNDGMFGDKPELRGESASLRCATRAHSCKRAAGPNYPTTSSLEADFVECAARADACPNGTDTSVPTACSPLADLRALAWEIKGLKKDPNEKIAVTGIFGWPLADHDGNPDFAKARYKIDRVPNPDPSDTANPQIWDYWPVCYDPDHQPKVPGSFDAEAWAWGARGGLRISAFIDEFGRNGSKYSICERDFTRAMFPFPTICVLRSNFCVDGKLMDVDLETPGLQPDCRVVYRARQTDSAGAVTYAEPTQSMPECPRDATPESVTADCWRLTYDAEKCPASRQLITIVRTAAEIADGSLEDGTRMIAQCWVCPDATSRPGCDYREP